MNLVKYNHAVHDGRQAVNGTPRVRHQAKHSICRRHDERRAPESKRFDFVALGIQRRACRFGRVRFIIVGFFLRRGLRHRFQVNVGARMRQIHQARVYP